MIQLMPARILAMTEIRLMAGRMALFSYLHWLFGNIACRTIVSQIHHVIHKAIYCYFITVSCSNVVELRSPM